MMNFFLALWCVIPLGIWAYHEGPGQDLMDVDRASALSREADKLAAEEQWGLSINKYQESLRLLPGERKDEARRVTLALAQVMMQNKGLPQAHSALMTLVDDLEADESADPALVSEARSALANAKYYVTWLMRLEGLAREEWEPEIEASRQIYRHLAEDAVKSGDETAATRYGKDLESAIRLARMNLGDLQGLPLPNQ